MGSGVIKPNISTLMGLTYDQQRPGNLKLRSDAFAIFYGAINIGAAISSFAMPWLRDRWGYQIAFLFPAGLMAVALLIFASGKRFYAIETVGRRAAPTPELRRERHGRSAAYFWAVHRDRLLLGHLRPVGHDLDLVRPRSPDLGPPSANLDLPGNHGIGP